MGVAEFQAQMDERGWYKFEDFVHPMMIQAMTEDLGRAYNHCRSIQVKNGLESTEGTCHHLIGHGPSFMDYLYKFEELDEYFTAYFQGRYILNSFGGNILESGNSYANKIHRDIRSYSGDLPLQVNTIVLLDDFTADNGATWLMDGGHRLKEKPSQEEFDAKKFQIIGRAGTVFVWNSNLWHCAGENKTDKPRRSVTPIYSRPFIKPGFDYCRAAEPWIEDYSPYIQQLLGYYSRIPTTLDGWYSKERFYRSDQG